MPLHSADEAPAGVAGGHLPPTVHDAPSMNLADIYAEHFDFVWRSVRRLGVPESSVDDAVQDVFVVVHRRLDEFEGRSSLKTWLFAIVRRVVRDHRPSPRRALADPGTLEALPDTASGPLECAAQAEAVRQLYRLLDELDADKREVFVLVDLEQMTAPEAAEAVGANVNTVYARLRAARRDLDAAMTRLRAQGAWRQACAT
jgi:RNA polymerase sigma-70 factor (ECF subfamily)